MQLLEKKAKCPLCGAKNPVEAVRCRTCTRPLANDPLPSQAVYQEALWSTKIATKSARKRTSPYAILAMFLVVLALANYFVGGYGPDWLHEPKAQPKGNEWKVYGNNADYQVDLPGLPIESVAKAPGTDLAAATVWVDGHWDLIRDSETQSVAALEVARKSVHAQLVTASGIAPADVASSIPAIVSSLAKGSVLTDGGVTLVDRPAYGEQYDLLTTFTGWPDESGTGTVRAHVTVVGGKLFVVASFIVGGDDADLQKRLVKAFQPAGV